MPAKQCFAPFRAIGRAIAQFFDGKASVKEIRKLTPYVQGGVGLTHVDPDGGDGDTEFLLTLGFGVELPISEQVSLGSQMTFNIVPIEVLDQSFYYAWEVATLRLRF